MSKDKPPRQEVPRGEDEEAGDSQPKPSGRLRYGGHIEHDNPQWEIHLRPKPLEEER